MAAHTLMSGNCYTLTPDQGGLAGSVFSANPVNLTQPFSLSIVMNFGCKNSNGADRIVFIFATTNTALGGVGGGIGYMGITPSIAIEYDDYQNGWGDPAEDHSAVISNGSVDHTQSTNLVGPIVLPEIEDCMDHCFSVDWDPVTQTLTGTLDDNVITYTGDIISGIFSGNPSVYYGFSAGTGSLSNLHVICIGPPVLVPMEDVTICEGESTQLDADENGIAWQWAHDPTLSATNIQNPLATPVQTTTYTVHIDYACGGSALDTVDVTLVPMPVADANNNGPLCVGETLILSGSGGNSYAWSGPQGYFSNQQNPQIVAVTIQQSGIYTVTVTDVAGCTGTASTQVFIVAPEDVEITPLQGILCENGDPVQLEGTPPGGVWSGQVDPSGIFDPSLYGVGVHTVTYTITDANGCTNMDQIMIEVVANTPALIIPDGPFCENDPVQQLSATPAGGTWGETADPNGQFDPGALGPGVYLITYTYSDQNGCFDAELYIEIFAVPDVVVTAPPPLCPNDTVQVISASPAGGTWSGDVSNNGTFDPGAHGPGMYSGMYVYQAPNGCADSASVDITVLPEAPQVSHLSLQCDSLATGYVVTFDITGGDLATLTVTSSSGGVLIPGNPSMYVSDTIVQGQSYSFIIDDVYGCDPTTIAGSFACSCATLSGSMDSTAIEVCEGDTVTVSSAIGTQLDPDDALIYVLHHGSANFLDNVVTSSSTGIFPFQPPLQTGVVYYISAVAGNSGPPLGVDLSDPCLSVAPGTPVRWTALPSGFLSRTGADLFWR